MSQNLCCFCRLQQGFEALFIMSRRTGRLAQACCCQPGCTCAELITVSFSADNIFNQEHRCCHFSAQTGVSVPDMHDETPVTGSRRPSGCTESPQVRKGGRENEKELRHLLSPSFPATAESTAHRGTGCLLPRQNKKRTSLDGFRRFLSRPNRWPLRQDHSPDHVFPAYLLLVHADSSRVLKCCQLRQRREASCDEDGGDWPVRPDQPLVNRDVNHRKTS